MSTKKTIGLLLGPALFALLALWPMPALAREAHLLLGVFAWAVVYWVTEVVRHLGHLALGEQYRHHGHHAADRDRHPAQHGRARGPRTASASMLVPTIIAVAAGAGVSPLPPVLGATLGASFGFMLPVSTPPNAIVYGTGLVPLREMMGAGIWLDVLGAVVIWVGLRILCPLLGMI